MFRSIFEFIEKLNFSYPGSIIKGHFTEIVALVFILLGGVFLLYGWKHHRYFLGVIGLLCGAILGLILKVIYSPEGVIVPFIYMAVFAGIGCAIAIYFERLMGILLGGIFVACVCIILFPKLFRPGDSTYVALSLAFLLGGGLGAISPRIFFILNAALLGSIFITYGISLIAVENFAQNASYHTRVVIHTLIFLPLLIFGILYQMFTSEQETEGASRSSTVYRY
jgi:hypothetical protein